MERLLIKQKQDPCGSTMYLFQVYDGVKDVTFFQIMVNDKVILESKDYNTAHSNYLFMAAHINCVQEVIR